MLSNSDETLFDTKRRHRQKFGYSKVNTIFKNGLIEDLEAAGIAEASVDVVISNCVLNLAADKGKALAEAWRVLKPGGELCFSDVFADRRVPVSAMSDKVSGCPQLPGASSASHFIAAHDRVERSCQSSRRTRRSSWASAWLGRCIVRIFVA